jgi:hypothetical protein
LGCTPHQIRAVSGHKTLKEIERYTAAIDQVTLADSAMKTISGTRTYKPNIPVVKEEKKA